MNTNRFSVFTKEKKIVISEDKSSMLNEFDIPTLSDNAAKLLVSSSQTNRTITDKFGDDFYKIMQAVNGKQTVKEICHQVGLTENLIYSLLSELKDTTHIILLPEQAKICVVFEELYNSLQQSLKHILGKKYAKLFKTVLDGYSNVYFKMIDYSTLNEISFNELIIEVTENSLNVQEFFSALLNPIMEVFKKIEAIYGEKVILQLKIDKIDELEEKFGSSIIEIIKFEFLEDSENSL